MEETRGNVPPERSRRRGATASDAADPAIEARLLDDDVVRKLLHRLNSVDQSRSAKQLSETPPLDLEGRNHVAPEEIEEFFASLSTSEPSVAPSLTENLPQERRWILLDLAKNGSGLARQRATQELRTDMQSVATWEGFDLHQLEHLVAELDEATAAGAPLLFEALRLAASRAVAQLVREAGAGS